MKVSIIIPCYNGEAFLDDSIGSVLAQSYSDIECIVIDDASTDGSRAMILDYAKRDPRVVPILLETNSGPSIARNTAIDAATGEWVTLLDADDVYDKDRIKILVELVESTGADIVVDNQSVRNFGEDAHRFDAFGFMKGPGPVAITQELFFKESLPVAFMNSGYLKPMFSLAFMNKHKLRFPTQYRVGEDFFLYGSCVAENPKFFAIDYCGYIYRRRQGSLSRSETSSLLSLANMSDELVTAFGSKLTAGSRAWLSKRKKIILQHIQWKKMKNLLKDGNRLEALLLLRRNPDLIFMVRNYVRRRLERFKSAYAMKSAAKEKTR